MSTDEALKVLEQVTAQVQATRDVHKAIEEALRVLRDAVSGEQNK